MDEDMRVEAEPTKALFIEMLTRDISLIPAILDLIDNAADGAQRLRCTGDYEGLFVRLSLSQKLFEISDNCSGIPVDIARKYAFRFGRDKKMPHLEHSIGEFGVGMKRAIFKLGRHFRVESKTETSRFVVEHDVNKWASDPKWEFEFSELEDDITIYEKDRGTTIRVTKLHKDVSESFGLENFVSELREEVQTRLEVFIARGLAITLNGIPVDANPAELLADDHFAPAYKEREYGKNENSVKVRLYSGLGKESRAELAGWYVYCNGRLILEADKTSTTGWGTTEDDALSVPQFHNQYNLFRGYAFFESDDIGKLPWNTTKTGINSDSPEYRATKLEMKMLMRPVIDFLNKLKEETAAFEEIAEEAPLRLRIQQATTSPVASVQVRELFDPPKKSTPQTKKPQVQRIQYDVPEEKFLAVKRSLKARNIKSVGEKTFNYYYDAEVEE